MNNLLTFYLFLKQVLFFISEAMLQTFQSLLVEDKKNQVPMLASFQAFFPLAESHGMQN